MTLQFTAIRTRRLTKSATVNGHPDYDRLTGRSLPGTEQPYKAEGFDGAVFCEDIDGNVYVYVSYMNTPCLDATLQPALREAATIYARDYWRSVGFNAVEVERLPPSKVSPQAMSLAKGEYERGAPAMPRAKRR